MAGTAIYVALQAIDWLKIMWGPILPHSSEQLHQMMGYDEPLFGEQYTKTIEDARGSHMVLCYRHDSATGKWKASKLLPGQGLRKPSALFEMEDNVDS